MTDLSKLKLGFKGSAELVVGQQHTAPRVGSGRVHVLATPVMINLMEAAALDKNRHGGGARFMDHRKREPS